MLLFCFITRVLSYFLRVFKKCMYFYSVISRLNDSWRIIFPSFLKKGYDTSLQKYYLVLFGKLTKRALTVLCGRFYRWNERRHDAVDGHTVEKRRPSLVAVLTAYTGRDAISRTNYQRARRTSALTASSPQKNVHARRSHHRDGDTSPSHPSADRFRHLQPNATATAPVATTTAARIPPHSGYAASAGRVLLASRSSAFLAAMQL